jgi:peroxiredoxin
MSDQRITPSVGTIFPDAEVVAADGSRSTLRREFHAPATVLYFMRSAHCPVCGSHVRALVREASAGAYGEARVVIVVPGDADAAQHIVGKTGAAVTVIASATAHAKAGLHVKTGLQQSGTFVLDANGVVRSARVATVPTGAFDHRDVIEALRRQSVVA